MKLLLAALDTREVSWTELALWENQKQTSHLESAFLKVPLPSTKLRIGTDREISRTKSGWRQQVARFHLSRLKLILDDFSQNDSRTCDFGLTFYPSAQILGSNVDPRERR